MNNFSYKLIDFFIQIEFVVRRSLAIFFKKFLELKLEKNLDFHDRIYLIYIGQKNCTI